MASSRGSSQFGADIRAWIESKTCNSQRVNKKEDKSEKYKQKLTYSFDLQGWRPLVLEDVKANATELVDVGMVDFGPEEHLWWDHWILIW